MTASAAPSPMGRGTDAIRAVGGDGFTRASTSGRLRAHVHPRLRAVAVGRGTLAAPAGSTSRRSRRAASASAASGSAAVALFERALRFAESLRASRPDEAEGHYWVAATDGNLIAFRDGPEKVRLARDIETSARRAL